MSKLPGFIQQYQEEPNELPKDPRNHIFPEESPSACNRDCRRFWMVNTKTISFALYATQDPYADPRRICAYAFSCGQDISSLQFRLKEGECPADLVRRVVPVLTECFLQLAEAEKEAEGIYGH